MKTYIRERNNIIISMLIFGTVGIFRRFLPLGSGVIAWARSLIGLVFLLLLCLIQKRRPDYKAMRKNLAPLLCSGCLLGLNWLVLFEAYNFTSVAAATMCYYMAPVFITLITALMGERLSRRKWICTAAVFCGMLLVSGVLETGLHGAKGLALGLLGAAMYAGIVMLNKSLKSISGEDRTIFQLAVSALTLLPYVLLKGELSGLMDISAPALLLLLTLGTLHTGLAYKLYFGAIEYVPAHTAALLSYIDPVTAVILSVALLREAMSLPAIMGCLVVIVSLILSEKQS